MPNHEPPIETLFPELRDYDEDDFARTGTTMPVLMVAMTARTGSAHLCSGLASVVGAGQPFEIFNARITLKVVKEKYGLETFEQLMSAAVERCSEYFIFKTVWIDFAYFADKIPLMFPNIRYVYLDRLDKEAQAVSLAKAIVSQEWHDSPIERRQRKMTAEEMMRHFDLRVLCRLLRYFENEKRQWEDFFFRSDIEPLRLFYEHFRDDLTVAGERILRYVNLPTERARRMQSEHKSLSDGVNEIWLKRLRSFRDGDPDGAG